ncbi:helix-turn-helix domain-containing protein [Kribbella sp. NPDC049174]|uniref:helix-turn-helix domain-containing protein n=1 Tax=Kribbella sp. NPDC049174 TaxID=3364112 RepID=UPI003714334A
MTSPVSPQNAGDATAVNLGLQLRTARQKSGMTLRELARQLGVSPSFLSQIENGKSQPSVATLYSMAQTLDVSIDHLFEGEEPAGTEDSAEPQPDAEVPAAPHRAAGDASGPVRRSDLGSLERVWDDSGSTGRLSVTSPGNRTRLVMDTGVVWEQLATNTAHQLDFIEIVYPPGSSSTNDERMLRHDGFEYGYLLEGELEVTFGFETFTLHAGEALGLNSSVPHLFRNLGTVPARGIWFVHHDH